MVHFRKCIGEEGAEKLFSISVNTRKDEIKTRDLIVDTTAQEKKITYPTDAKLLVKVIAACNKITRQENLKQRQSYKHTVKRLMLKQPYQKNHAKEMPKESHC
ncbi:MAG: hypothetical protein CSB03_01025 [Bacteroidia bacterium]|nr:MAG: hypothetical protein CSB03_01025 [Bacteroidia bacterium]PIF05244.1 MAG: hypothetical protein CSA36_07675 [Draconibacterium sp.]